MQPTARQSEILSAVITEFTRTGQPVASRTLRARYGLDCSPATIRHELKVLEELGLLSQPHASSGRVPTQGALRLFIDALMRVGSVQATDAKRIAAWFGQLSPGADIPRETGLLLSELSGTAALLIRPRVETRALIKLHMVPTRPGELLAVLVFADGQVHHHFLKQPQGLGPAELERLHNLLDSIVPGRTLLEIKQQLEAKVQEFRDELGRVCQLAVAALDHTLPGSPSAGDVIVLGSARLLEHPQFQDTRRAHAMLRTLSDHESLLNLLPGLFDAASSREDPLVYLGNEGLMAPGCPVSFVVSSFFPQPQQLGADEQKPQGALGVIGPMPMDYPAMVPLVRAVAQAMTVALAKSQ